MGLLARHWLPAIEIADVLPDVYWRKLLILKESWRCAQEQLCPMTGNAPMWAGILG
jgi:hypothetical protein